jgi:putative ABC transport system substrate-binding protein
MRRREFIELVGAATTWPLVAHAQKTTIPVIGYLSARSAGSETALRTPFLKALAEGGFVAGRDVLVEYRFADGHEDQLRGLAADLVRRPVSMLVAAERPSALAAKAATSTIPIVFSTGDDPVRLGLVKSVSHPGGNATGVHIFTTLWDPSG